jgi:sirohydrochlorin cobaltochelatase
VPTDPAPATGTVLFAHGSRDPLWRAPIEAVANRMRQLTPGTLVECAYLEFSAPDLATAVQTLLNQGVVSVAVWPMFLGAGRHVREDLPVLLDELRQRHPQVAIGLHPAIAEHPDVLEAMARTALGAPQQH